MALMKNSRIPALLFCVTLAVAAIQSAIVAGTIVIPTSLNPIEPGTDNQGWYSNVSRNGPGNDNYFTGAELIGKGVIGNADTHRSWFAFDLTGISGTVTSARFNVQRYEQIGTVELGLFDVSTLPTQLPSNRGSPINAVTMTVFGDLGTGNSYGIFTVPEVGSPDVLSLNLNATAVSDINGALGGYFAIGARVLNSGAATIFSSSSLEPGNGGPGFTQDLVLEVVPAVPDGGSTVWMVVIGIGALTAWGRRCTETGGDERTCLGKPGNRAMPESPGGQSAGGNVKLLC